MTSRLSMSFRALVLPVLLLGSACSSQSAPPAQQSWSGVCVDSDGDGFGFQCNAGMDCDDDDPTLTTSCASCSKPQEGCACAADAAPVDCRLPYTLDSAGVLLCHVGTRYCRDNQWSACEGIATFAAPGTPGSLLSRARIDRDAAPVACDWCSPDCYRIEDPLQVQPDAALGPGIVSASSGGITLGYDPRDAGLPQVSDSEVLGSGPCASDDSDCDGIPDPYDSDPTRAPSGATQRAVFLSLGPGESARRTFENALRVRSADVYFYLDLTGSMDDERSALVADFANGNFLPSAGTSTTCADHDADGAPDDQLKAQGIAGNLRCLVRDLQLGTGFFRDIPFKGPFASTAGLVAPSDYEMFEHRQDLTQDYARVASVVNAWRTRPNYNTPEGSMQGLWALATGAELYAGWDRPGIPARAGCPAGRWGYPCFRQEALPVVVQITAAPMQNGPATPFDCLSAPFLYDGGVVCEPRNYDNAVLSGLSAGSEARYRPLSAPAEDFASAEPVPAVGDALLTYVGDTTGMQSNITSAQLPVGSCLPWGAVDEASPDVVFAVQIVQSGVYLFSTRGSRFDTTLVLVPVNGDGSFEVPRLCSDDTDVSQPDDPGQLLRAAELEADLSPGRYLLVVKGYDRRERGMFQVTVGRPELATEGSFQARTWLGANSTRDALVDAGMRVLTVRSSADGYLEQQAMELARATDAVDNWGGAVAPLRDLDTNIGDEIVEGVRRVLSGVHGAVSVRLLRSPDAPSPPFQFRPEAISRIGDGCTGLAGGNADAGIPPDRHAHCGAGSMPRFAVQITNPAGAPVPDNAADPARGYHLTMQVLLDDRYVLEQYPVYILPRSLTGPVPTPWFLPTGSYEEVVPAKGCLDGDLPFWRQLGWEATLPTGTQLALQVCAQSQEGSSEPCEFQQVAMVEGGQPCTTHDQCGPSSYCDEVCHHVTGKPCTSDLECGAEGVCLAGEGGHFCAADRPAVDLQPLGALHGKRFARVRLVLRSNATHTQAPTVHRWSLEYTCAPQE